LCEAYVGKRIFKPIRVPMSELETLRLELSELETMRLCDVEGLSQHEAGLRMGVSRGTVQRLVKRGRAKVVEALVDSKALLIQKGDHDEDRTR
jgi:predicted DNA-binding protein (UPF0251 family)